MATCTPCATAAAISCATRCTTSGARPIWPPPKVSPESLRRTRRACVTSREPSLAWSTVVTVATCPWSSPGRGVRSAARGRGAAAGRCSPARDLVGPGAAWPGPPARYGGRTGPGGASGADAVAHELRDRAAGLGHDLADRLLRVLRERLVHEDDVLEEAAQATLDDLRQRGLGLALVARGLLGDAALVLDGLGGDLVAREVRRRHRRDVLRDVLRDGLARGVGRDDDTDRRRQVARRAVQVRRDALARDAGHAAQDDLLAERRRRVVDDGLDGLAVRVRGEGRVGVARTRGGSGLEHAVREVDERLVLRDEVGLRVELDEGRRLAALDVADVDGHEALGGGTALALGDALQTLDADDLERLVGVAAGLVERLLDVEHAGAGALAQRLDVSGGVVRHGGSSLVVRHGYVLVARAGSARVA